VQLSGFYGDVGRVFYGGTNQSFTAASKKPVNSHIGTVIPSVITSRYSHLHIPNIQVIKCLKTTNLYLES
jgi:hypothetical protein